MRAIVALADIGGSQSSESGVTIGELLDERLELTQPWYRMFTITRQSQRWLDRMNAVLGEGRRKVQRDSTLDGLPQLERAVALATVAIAERPTVVMLDQLDAFADPRDETAFVAAVCSLANATTVIVIGTPPASRLGRTASFANATGGREHIDLDLSRQLDLPESRQLSTEGVVR